MLDIEREKSMTRKEYLKSKKKEKAPLHWLKNVALLLVIVALSLYVINQLKVYNSVTEIANKMVEESKLIKTYKMYFMGEPYTKGDNQRILYYYRGTDESRIEIKSGKGIKFIKLDDENNIYGVKDNNLIKIDTTNDTSETLVIGNISNYVITSNGILVYKDYGKNSSQTGVYNMDGNQIISGVIYQMLSDNKSIYIVKQDSTSRSLLEISLDGKSKKLLSGKDIVNNIVQDEKNIYYSTSSKKGYICKVSKDGGESTIISHSACVTDSVNFSGESTMTAYNGNIIYINSNDNMVYISNQNEDDIVVNNAVDQIQLRGNMLYFTLKDKIEIYRYNIEKGVLEKITSARTNEMICSN